MGDDNARRYAELNAKMGECWRGRHPFIIKVYKILKMTKQFRAEERKRQSLPPRSNPAALGHQPTEPPKVIVANNFEIGDQLKLNELKTLIGMKHKPQRIINIEARLTEDALTKETEMSLRIENDAANISSTKLKPIIELLANKEVATNIVQAIRTEKTKVIVLAIPKGPLASAITVKSCKRTPQPSRIPRYVCAVKHKAKASVAVPKKKKRVGRVAPRPVIAGKTITRTKGQTVWRHTKRFGAGPSK